MLKASWGHWLGSPSRLAELHRHPPDFHVRRWRGWWWRERWLPSKRLSKCETTRGQDNFVTRLWQQNRPALDSNYNLFLTLTKWVSRKETSTSTYQNVRFLHIHGLHECIFPAFTPVTGLPSRYWVPVVFAVKEIQTFNEVYGRVRSLMTITESGTVRLLVCGVISCRKISPFLSNNRYALNQFVSGQSHCW